MITFDAVTTHSPGSDDVYSFSHTTSGTDRYLLVGIGIRAGSGQVVNGITYGGVAMTLAVAKTSTAAGNVTRGELWYLLNPTVGANTVEVTMSIAVRTGAVAISFSEVNQAAPEATNSSEHTQHPISTSVTTLTDNAWVVDFVNVLDNTTYSFTAGADQTERADLSWSTGFNGGTFALSHKGPVSPTGSVTMSQTGTNDSTWVQMAVVLSAGPMTTTSTTTTSSSTTTTSSSTSTTRSTSTSTSTTSTSSSTSTSTTSTSTTRSTSTTISTSTTMSITTSTSTTTTSSSTSSTTSTTTTSSSTSTSTTSSTTSTSTSSTSTSMTTTSTTFPLLFRVTK